MLKFSSLRETGYSYPEARKLQETYLNPDTLRVHEFARDLAGVPEEYRSAIPHLLSALREIDTLFMLQDHPQSETIRGLLIREGRRRDVGAARAVFDMFNGPIGVTLENEAVPIFGGVYPRPLGGGLYLGGVTKERVDEYLQRATPEQVEAVTRMNTLVDRGPGGSLTAIPYESYYSYKRSLERVYGALMRATVEIKKSGDPGFEKYLMSRAVALRSGDYYESDVNWIRSTRSPLDVIIGPLESYKDGILGKKAFYAGMVTIRDDAASQRLVGYLRHMQDLEEALPQPAANAKQMSGVTVPVAVVRVLAMAGDYKANRPYITIGQTLPNDERVLRDVGRKIFIYANVMEGTEEPDIVAKLLDPSLMQYVTPRSQVNSVSGHEVSHSLGPKMTDGRVGPVREITTALGQWGLVLEELKADLLAAFNMPMLVRLGVYTEEEARGVYVHEGLRRNLPKTKAEIGSDVHYVGNLMKLNYFLQNGGILFNGERFSMDFDAFQASLRAMVTEVLAIQSLGDQAKAEEFIRRWAVWGPEAEYARQVQTQSGSKFYNMVNQPLLELVR